MRGTQEMSQAPANGADPGDFGPPAADRLDDLEARVAEMPQIVQALSQQSALLDQIQQQVIFLSQQRAVAELQMERHTRATALDLAIKAAGEKPDLDRVTLLAGGFLAWLKEVNS